MQLVGEGGMIELQIPSAIGYGARGAPPVIPPNATLHFVVELLDVR
jgi:FKBP-type peptidyl-prolyl cis-trans isomerase